MKHYRVQKFGLIISCFVLATILFLVAAFCFVAADLSSYSKFLGKVRETMSGKTKTPYYAEQLRQGISREIWFLKDSQKLQAFLTADEAEIAYEGIGNSMEIVEQLKGVKGWVQERVYWSKGNPLQSVRYFEADTAVYRSARHDINADQVKMVAFNTSGHELERQTVDIDKASIVGTASSMEISLIEKEANFKGDVRLNYANEKGGVCYVYAEFGQYVKGEDSSKIRLWSENKQCEACDPDMLKIYADVIEVDPKQQTIVFIESKGTVFFDKNGPEKNEMEFASDTIVYDQIKDECLLRGNVAAVFPLQNMVLTTDNELCINKSDGELSRILSKGKTVLTCETEEKDFTLICNGEIVFDNKKLTVDALNEKEGEQLFFKDRMGKIYSDQAKLEYQEINNKMVPIKIIYTGNVRVLNREPPFLQQALADKLTYNFSTSEVLFEAGPRKRVLFFDQANNLKMSAKGLNMIRDKNTKKDSIKGIGDVRLRFDEQEIARLKKRFLMENEPDIIPDRKTGK